MLENDLIYDERIDTGKFYLYWNLNGDSSYSAIIEVDYEDNDQIYDDDKKGIYGQQIYGKIYEGDSIMEAFDSLNYFKNFLIYYGATCR